MLVYKSTLQSIGAVVLQVCDSEHGRLFDRSCMKGFYGHIMWGKAGLNQGVCFFVWNCLVPLTMNF